MSGDQIRAGIIGAGWWALGTHWKRLQDDQRAAISCSRYRLRVSASRFSAASFVMLDSIVVRTASTSVRVSSVMRASTWASISAVSRQAYASPLATPQAGVACG